MTRKILIIFLLTTSAILRANDFLEIGAGGIMVVTREMRSDSTDFILKNSIYLHSTVIKDRAGYFLHFLYSKDTVNLKENMGISTGYFWFKPVKSIDIRAGKLKKPADKSYLSPYFTWTFPLQPAIFSLLKKYQMVPSFPGLQLSWKPLRWIKLQGNIFQMDKNSTNFHYFSGIEIKKEFNKVEGNIFYFHGFQPTYAEITLPDNSTEKIKRNSNLAGVKLKFYNTTIFYQFVDMRGAKTDSAIYFYSNLIDLSYRIFLNKVTLQPKFRFEFLKNAGNLERYYTTGIDFIFFESKNPLAVVKMGIEYSGSREAGFDQIKSFITVAHF